MNNLIIRTLTGTVFVFVLLTALWVGSYAFLLFFGAVVFIGTFEVVSLVAEKQKKTGFALFCAFIALLIFLFSNGDKFFYCLSLPYNYLNNSYILLFFIPIVGLFSRKNSRQIKLIGAGVSGAFILSMSFSTLTTIFSFSDGFLLTLAFVGGWLNTESKISCLCQDSNPDSFSP